MNGFSSEESEHENLKEIDYDLCKFMRPPNPLIEKGAYINSEVKIAMKLNLVYRFINFAVLTIKTSKLPDFVTGESLYNKSDANKMFEDPKDAPNLTENQVFIA